MTEQEMRSYLRQIQEDSSEAAFRKLYNLCFDRFYRIAFYYLQTEEWTQEVVLDVFMKIWEKRQTLNRVANLDDYFFITVKNAALNYLKKEWHRMEVAHEASQTVTEPEHSPEEILISEELFARYVRALDLLPERRREIFIRIREEKQTYAQAAHELGISVNTVDVQLQKAIHELRELLSDDTE